MGLKRKNVLRKRTAIINEGDRIGYLVFMKESFVINKRGVKVRVAHCVCDCGNNHIISGLSRLLKGMVKSCGCKKGGLVTESKIKHGLTNSRLYRIWAGVKTRCYNKNDQNYLRYGARGITMCANWKNSFECFYQWAINNGYSDDLSLDRIRNERGYYPLNCRWSTRVVQNNNTRTNYYLDYNGVKMTLSEICRLENLSDKYKTIWDDLREKNMSIEDSVSKRKNMICK